MNDADTPIAQAVSELSDCLDAMIESWCEERNLTITEAAAVVANWLALQMLAQAEVEASEARGEAR